ncbi:MAG: Glycosyltransferase-like protein [candidate division TM6 bacterium GW2011_GWF2_37_49]|nr:MAG: Glycosyltransferase-like protein [candidate division TM6 bacterium GW2011_GWF2_37_49]
MININNKNLTFVVYDGIKNSVFQSQVLAPLLNELEERPDLNIKLVCFEKDIAEERQFATKLKGHPRLDIIFFKKYPFFGKPSMMYAIKCFRGFLKIDMPDQIIARGPLAGYIVLKALSNKFNIHTTVQARGLCAEEYRYSVQKTNGAIKKIWDKFIFKSMKKIELYVYSSSKIKIEAVSPALKDYLVKQFQTEPANILMAVKDIPKSVDKCQAVVWSSQVRDELQIHDKAIVYCYSGSFKLWQCAEQTIECFAFEYFKDNSLFMLVLTNDIKPFKHELERFKIPTSNYRILNVQPQDLNKYLCAANFGMLIREADIINWVSRPTKMLEYQACGLKIIHNNTVAWLATENNV